jgi:prevent-host-death family protein
MVREFLSVTEAKKRFSELVERVERGHKFVVHHDGKPVMAMVPPTEALARPLKPLGLAAAAGALSDWDDLESLVEKIYAARRSAADRSTPDLE